MISNDVDCSEKEGSLLQKFSLEVCTTVGKKSPPSATKTRGVLLTPSEVSDTWQPKGGYFLRDGSSYRSQIIPLEGEENLFNTKLKKKFV